MDEPDNQDSSQKEEETRRALLGSWLVAVLTIM